MYYSRSMNYILTQAVIRFNVQEFGIIVEKYVKKLIILRHLNLLEVWHLN